MKMAEVDAETSSSTDSISRITIATRRPTIIRAGATSRSASSEPVISKQCATTSTTTSTTTCVDSIAQSPFDSSSAVIKRPPSRPAVGPLRHSSSFRSASVSLRSTPRLPSRPTSVHLPISHPPSLKRKPAVTTAAAAQRKRPEITIVSAQPLNEVPGFAKNSGSSFSIPGLKSSSKPTTPSVAQKAVHSGPNQPVAAPRQSLGSTEARLKSENLTVGHQPDPSGVSGTGNMSGAPPPLPTTRPKSTYVPPPLPSTRPKGAYQPPISVSSSSVVDKNTPGKDPNTYPKPRPRSVVSEAEDKSGLTGDHKPPPLSEKPVSVPTQLPLTSKFEKPITPTERSSHQLNNSSTRYMPVPPKLADKPALISSSSTSSVLLPKLPLKPPAPVSNHTEIPSNASALHQPPSRPAMPLKPPAEGTKYSRADILSLFDNTYQKTSKPESSSEDALRLGSLGARVAASDGTRSKNEVEALHLASAAAQNTSADDVHNISQGAKMLSKSEDGQKAVGSFTRIAKSTASDVSSSENTSSGLKWQVANSAAKNVTADDAKNLGKAGMSVAKSEEGRKAASSIFSIAKASLSQVNKESKSNPPAQSPTARARPKNTGGSLMDLMLPSKTSSQPPAPRPGAAVNKAPIIPKFKIASEPVAAKTEGLLRTKPTIIRPGAEKSGSKPNSRNNSPESKRRVPPPRPSCGPSKPSAGPTGSSQSKQGSTKPKRQAPARPGGRTSRRSTQSESFPSKPGTEHPPKYTGSDPHGIALYDYKPLQADELEFKANDVIMLVERVDADWLKGRRGQSEGLIPASFLNIVKDAPQAATQTTTQAEPCAIAKFTFEGSAKDELSFQVGDNIILLDTAGDQWYQGQCNGRTGIFPANFVDVIKAPSVQPASGGTAIAGPRCRAKFDYDSENSDDLSFKMGAVIQLVDSAGPQWLKGRLNGKTGIFPESFVEIIQALPAITNGNTGSVVIATFDFEGTESNEISFKEGTKITVLSRVNSDWLHGEVGGVRGNFPEAFVETAQKSKGSDKKTCTALYDFKAEDRDELTIKNGDVIEITQFLSSEWLIGKLHGRMGKFPKAFVDIR